MTSSDAARPPLGLPPGSIRGLLSLQIVITFWLLLAMPEDKQKPIPMNLYFLLTMVFVFFVSHGKSIAKKADPTPSPLWLPGGTLRLVIVGGTVAILAFLAVNHPTYFDRLTPDRDSLHEWKYYLAATCGGFFVGYLFRLFPFRNSWAFQSFQAWMSLIAMFSLFLETILQVFVKPTLSENLDFLTWQTAVTGIVACYYGTRS